MSSHRTFCHPLPLLQFPTLDLKSETLRELSIEVNYFVISPPLPPLVVDLSDFGKLSFFYGNAQHIASKKHVSLARMGSFHYSRLEHLPISWSATKHLVTCWNSPISLKEFYWFSLCRSNMAISSILPLTCGVILMPCRVREGDWDRKSGETDRNIE